MHTYTDLMLTKDKALPAEGADVIVRIDDNVYTHKYEGEFPKEIISWIWPPKATCKCHVYRWKPELTKFGECPDCGTFWLDTSLSML